MTVPSHWHWVGSTATTEEDNLHGSDHPLSVPIEFSHPRDNAHDNNRNWTSNSGCTCKGYIMKVHKGHAPVVCFASQMTSGAQPLYLNTYAICTCRASRLSGYSLQLRIERSQVRVSVATVWCCPWARHFTCMCNLSTQEWMDICMDCDCFCVLVIFQRPDGSRSWELHAPQGVESVLEWTGSITRGKHCKVHRNSMSL